MTAQHRLVPHEGQDGTFARESANSNAGFQSISLQSDQVETHGPDAFRIGMRRLASGVTIVTAAAEDGLSGLVATSVASVSVHPPAILVCVNRFGTSHEAIKQSGHFCINVLGQADREVAYLFSRPNNHATRFQSSRWSSLRTGAPALVDCLASFDCRISETADAGTHTVFFGQVLETRLWADSIKPLLYWDGAYRE
ncbi:flavin reductase family protein [Microvirga alba]|uniref:Flavin reductase n=1 Tax=Microvirga alba TaxID=2791025 RepID=A0A931FLK7_9HYPH|nr:flavin reductase family protein [Microvirga alba]MBF9232219.1 flavin reductase [Microvirga alba]